MENYLLINALAADAPAGTLTGRTIDLGDLERYQVDVRVTHVGICHTDVGMIDNEWGFSQYPLVPGHEIVGVVEAIGEAVVGLEVGQRVGVGALCGSCMTCEWCLRGQQHVCPNGVATIFGGHHGGFASHVRVDDFRFAFALPDSLASEHAAPLMCAGATAFTPFVHYGVKPTDRVAIVGIGGLGHLAVQYAAAWGCEVTAISSTNAKRDEARALGAHHFVASGDEGAMATVRGKFDFILSTVGADLPWTDYVEALRPQGTLCIAGTSPSPFQVSLYHLLSEERRIVGGKTGALDDTAQMLTFTARHNITPMIEQFAMSDADAAVDRVRRGDVRYRAVLEA
ncbi:uncharacterized zinc-type alcohol dehydrogenase-like protein [Plantibacter sp. VKM Ac-1784]|uniref:alcohol dehydrogenase (NADP(+)) n=1 Tax=Plantibacter elymi (nom. nud.) TaxID=199708 RepID=A0ABY1RG79_9MICO|nr:NAD(P)-dependent alcohol dehydrogenase [Plantibacter sp. VKM Ac-1784]SMQ71273.1 uncharacterized zinc-type alcohol dehydrogenase-like protein [Plantibacter sp. VKM Ac-1784]